jgi:replicative DNA helicase
MTHYDGPSELEAFQAWLNLKGLLKDCECVRLIRVFSPSAATLELLDWNVSQLREARFRRDGQSRAKALADRFGSPGENCEDVLTAAGDDLRHLASVLRGPERQRAGLDAGVEDFLACFTASMKGEGEPGPPSRWEAWNREMGHVQPGEFIVIGGATSSGKSALAANLTLDVLLAGQGVAFFSYEMPRRQVIARLIADLANVEFSKVFRPAAFRPSETEHRAVLEATQQLRKLPLHLFDNSSLTPAGIRAECQAIQASGSLAMVVVDYLQLMPTSRDDKGANREQVVAGVSRDLRALSLELDIAVVALSQLNDQGAFRESRAIGQDATMAVAIEDGGLRIAKSRNGPRGMLLPITLEGRWMRFVEKEAA